MLWTNTNAHAQKISAFQQQTSGTWSWPHNPLAYIHIVFTFTFSDDNLWECYLLLTIQISANTYCVVFCSQFWYQQCAGVLTSGTHENILIKEHLWSNVFLWNQTQMQAKHWSVLDMKVRLIWQVTLPHFNTQTESVLLWNRCLLNSKDEPTAMVCRQQS